MRYAKFDPTDVLPDRAIFPFDGGLDIEGFLEREGSPLAHMEIGKRTIGMAIKEACRAFDVRPEFVIVSLQTEAGLIHWYRSHVKPPTQEVLDWALGVGKLDDGRVIESLRGLDKQILSCAKSVRQIIRKVTPMVGKPYRLDAAKGTEDYDSFVTAKTIATLVLYEYTPHFSAAELRFQVYKQFFAPLLNDAPYGLA